MSLHFMTKLLVFTSQRMTKSLLQPAYFQSYKGQSARKVIKRKKEKENRKKTQPLKTIIMKGFFTN